jgi:D-alanyl-D-alanine endopeptidase (penicillin-binding protein 7)
MSAAALVQALGWALIGFVWQGALVALGLLCVLHLLPARQARLRYALACAALGLCVALPLVQLLDTLSRGAAGQAMSTIGPVAASVAQDGRAAARSAVMAWLGRRLPMLVCLWAVVAALLMARHALGLWWVRSLIRDARLPAPATLQRRAASLAGAMGLDRDVCLVLTKRLATPVTAGCWKPVVLLPASLVSGMPADLLEALIAHELAHVRRHDYLVNLLQTTAETLLFYHPAVWWISRVIRIEREHVADDLAADVLGEPRRLALALSELEKLQPASHQLVQASHGGKLMFRIQRLVRPSAQPRASGVAVAAFTITVACAALAARAQVVPDTPAAQALAFDVANCARPQWPEASLRNEEEGVVEATFLIGTDGQVKDARITKSTGFRDLDRAVLKAFRTCRTTSAPVRETWLSISHVWNAKSGRADAAAAPAAQG